MLSKKEKELVDYLSKMKRWVTSKELAEFSNYTTRTIRNRIAQINEENPGLILTSHLGYQLNMRIDIKSDETEDRKSRIFLELLKYSSEGIDFYELAEKLFISESTLKSDIQQLKKEITNDTIKIIIEKNHVKLIGPERAKRRYIISLLYNESDLQEKLKISIQKMIGYISLEKLQVTIKDVLSKKNIQINQYSLNNIVLHFAISIDRIRQGHNLKNKKNDGHIKNSNEFLIAEEISNKLIQQYDIYFSQAEIEQLSLLFIGIQNESLAKNDRQKLSNFVNQKIIIALNDVLEEVGKTYLVDLHDEDFFNKLAIHLQSLYYRSQYETFTRNSNLLDLKTAYPLIYDLAIYISSLIQDKLDIWFNDDEISFIALHIGSFLETQKNFNNQIRIQLVVNDYHDIGQKLRKQLEDYFGELINISVKEKDEVVHTICDLVLTTDRSLASLHDGAVFIHPFLTNKDAKKIENRIRSLMSQKEKRHMYQAIEKFILPELYFNQIDPVGLKPIEIRKQINQRMVNERFVDSIFLKRVEKRERMSPTSFPSGIAVPHSVELEALKSGVAIMTLQEPLVWAENSVSLIAYIAINKEEADEFNHFFEKFIEIVSEPVNTKLLSKSEDYEEFILRLKTMVDVDE